MTGYPGTASSSTSSLALVSQVLLGKVPSQPTPGGNLDAASAAQPAHAPGAEQRLYAFLTVWAQPQTAQGSPPQSYSEMTPWPPNTPRTGRARGLGPEPRSSDLELPL